MNSQPRYYLGIDGGGSHCRARLESSDGVLLGYGHSGPANPRLGFAEAVQSIMDATAQALKQAELGSEVLGELYTGMGLAGVNLPEIADAMHRRSYPFAHTEIVSDAHIACLGAHGGEDGAILIVGTGSIGWAMKDGVISTVGGYGFAVSDEGSGSWLGLEALRLTLQASSGLADTTPLCQEILAGFNNNPELLSQHFLKAAPSEYASLAPTVIKHAEQQDANALQLLERAVSALDQLTTQLLAEHQRVSLVGGLSTSISRWMDPAIIKRTCPPLEDATCGAIRLIRSVIFGEATT